MRAVVFDGQVRYVADRQPPAAKPGWAIVRVSLAGICRTDIEIARGYMGFTGVLGHEFVGRVEACADEPSLVGRRVVGEINAACGHCSWCSRGMGRHCPNRSVLGINGLDGCMAELCSLPAANLLEVPGSVPDARAVFVEPLAAACEILEQVPLGGSERAVVLGDGKLGILCAWVLATRLPDVMLAGRHAAKLAAAQWRGVRTALRGGGIAGGVDVVVEATGSSSGLAEAVALCRPRGTIVLKSTLAAQSCVDLAPIVIGELTIVGSRCGRFHDAVRMMADCPDMPLERLVSARYPIEDAEEAFRAASQPGSLKVLVETD